MPTNGARPDGSNHIVIVGGGLAGLVLGSRLSENATMQILVLEAGGNGDDVRSQIGRCSVLALMPPTPASSTHF